MPAPLSDKNYLHVLARYLASQLPKNTGFILLVAPMTDVVPPKEDDVRVVYTSNICREDARAIMLEWLAHNRELDDLKPEQN
jgi:hypothetical protein